MGSRPDGPGADGRGEATRLVSVPEWGGTVRVRELTGAERWEFQSFSADSGNSAWLVVHGIVDDVGRRVLADQDLQGVGGKSALALRRVSDVVAELSGLTKAAFDASVGEFQDHPEHALYHRLALALKMTVPEILARHTSAQLTQWAAYERVAGPVDDSYLAGVLAALHEQIQTLNRMTGAAHFTDKNHRKNPAPEPKHYPRPHELHKRDDSSDEEDDDN